MKTPLVRTLGFFGVFILVAGLPWWLSSIALIILTIYFNYYIEVLFFGFMIDSLYFWQKTYIYPALSVALILFFIVTFVKTKIRT